MKLLTKSAAAAISLATLIIAPVASAANSTTAVVAWGTTNSAPAGFRATLSGVATAGPTDVWAVGAFNPDQQGSYVLDQPYAEHWDGSAWTANPVTAPSLYGTHQTAELNGAAAVGPGEAWAVGDVADSWSSASQTLAYHWTGQAWTRTTTPNPGGSSSANRFLGVAARSASDVWAVGQTGTSYPPTSLVARWNGSAWSTVSTPNIGALQAVAVDATNVWVAGITGVQRFDGVSWHALPALPVSNPSSGLFIHGLAKNASGLWAVGTLTTPYFDGSIDSSYAAVFNGTTWTQVGVAGSGLDGAAVSGSTILASALNDGVFRLGPSSVTQEVTPAPGTVYPNAVATDSLGNAWAVGTSPTSGGGQVPGIINAPGIGQGGIIVTAGAANATVTWTGPVNHSGTADVSGHFAVGGLPDGTYTVISSLSGCNPGVATATVTAGVATPVNAPVVC